VPVCLNLLIEIQLFPYLIYPLILSLITIKCRYPVTVIFENNFTLI